MLNVPLLAGRWVLRLRIWPERSDLGAKTEKKPEYMKSKLLVNQKKQQQFCTQNVFFYTFFIKTKRTQLFPCHVGLVSFSQYAIFYAGSKKILQVRVVSTFIRMKPKIKIRITII